MKSLIRSSFVCFVLFCFVFAGLAAAHGDACVHEQRPKVATCLHRTLPALQRIGAAASRRRPGGRVASGVADDHVPFCMCAFVDFIRFNSYSISSRIDCESNQKVGFALNGPLFLFLAPSSFTGFCLELVNELVTRKTR